MKAIVGIVMIAGFAIYGGSGLIGMVRGSGNLPVPQQTKVEATETVVMPRSDFMVMPRSDFMYGVQEVRSRPPKPRCHWTRGRLYWDYDDHEMKYVAGRCVYDDQ